MKHCCHSGGLISNAALIRTDPTRTTTIQRGFAGDIRRRLKKLILAVWDFMAVKDALALSPIKKQTLFQHAVSPRQYEFLTDASKIKAFRQWLQEQINANILAVPEGGNINEPWTSKYIESSYRMGLINAFTSTRNELDKDDPKFIDRTQEQFLRDSFAQPERLSKVQLLATRSFSEMENLSDRMKTQLNRILAQGMADGRGALDVAREMRKQMVKMSDSRSLMIARTEIIHAHAEGQLDGFQDLGVEELGITAEWSTAGDDRVCPQCSALEGQIFSVEEARGLIPKHPQCRCSWIPRHDKPVTKKEKKQ